MRHLHVPVVDPVLSQSKALSFSFGKCRQTSSNSFLRQISHSHHALALCGKSGTDVEEANMILEQQQILATEAVPALCAV